MLRSMSFGRPARNQRPTRQLQTVPLAANKAGDTRQALNLRTNLIAALFWCARCPYPTLRASLSPEKDMLFVDNRLTCYLHRQYIWLQERGISATTLTVSSLTLVWSVSYGWNSKCVQRGFVSEFYLSPHSITFCQSAINMVLCTCYYLLLLVTIYRYRESVGRYSIIWITAGNDIFAQSLYIFKRDNSILRVCSSLANERVSGNPQLLRPTCLALVLPATSPTSSQAPNAA